MSVRRSSFLGSARTGLSIAGKLALMTMAGVGLIFLLIIAYGYVSSVGAMEAEFHARIENLGEATASKIRRIPRVAEAVTHDLATILRSFRPDPEQLRNVMKSLIEPHPEVSGLFVGFSRQTGDALLDNFCPFVYRQDSTIGWRNLAEVYDWTVWDWYQLPLQLGKPVWTEPFFGNEGTGSMVVDYCVPIYDENWRYLASIGTSIELHWLTNAISTMNVGNNGYIFLITANGTIVSHPRREIIMKETVFSISEEEGNPELWDLGRRMVEGKRGLFRYHDRKRDRRLLVWHQPIEGMGWSLGIVFPEKEILAGVNRLSRTQFLLGLAGMAGMLAVSLFVASRISRPIRSLKDATQLLASGRLDAPLPPISGNDEVARLTESFTSMRDSLLVHIEELRATTAARERIESELDIARSIQMSLIPRTFPPFPKDDRIDLFAMLEPAREVGGDFYDFFMTDGNHLLLVVGDVSGKGVPAALFMAVTRSFMKAFASMTDSVSDDRADGPAALLSAVNDRIVEGNDACMFVTLFCATVDLRDGSFRYANGGHPSPWKISGGRVVPLARVKGPLVGAVGGVLFEEGAGRLLPGDSIFMFTDGVTEALNGREELLGEARVETWLSETSFGNPESTVLLERMRERISLFVGGAEQSDDITMLCFRYKGPEMKTTA
jgi:sigma-B regulation protein RsbU (phosphoserine phosphatase)